jgi:hypothetical protein
MKIIILGLSLLILAASCSTPASITARPDPTAATSGTLGSVKATNGYTLQQNGIPTSEDTTIIRK